MTSRFCSSEMGSWFGMGYITRKNGLRFFFLVGIPFGFVSRVLVAVDMI